MTDDKVVCRSMTPGKASTAIPRWKFDAVREAVLGSVTWRLTVVKGELEARGELVRDPRARPQRLRLG